MYVHEKGDFFSKMAVMMNESKGQVSHKSTQDLMIPHLINSGILTMDLLWWKRFVCVLIVFIFFLFSGELIVDI
jgi:hypothetical protein